MDLLLCPSASVEEYDTVLLAVGRDPDTGRLGLDKLGVTTDRHSGKIVTDDSNQTSVDNIYAIGDIVQVRLGGLMVLQAGELCCFRALLSPQCITQCLVLTMVAELI